MAALIFSVLFRCGAGFMFASATVSAWVPGNNFEYVRATFSRAFIVAWCRFWIRQCDFSLLSECCVLCMSYRSPCSAVLVLYRLGSRSGDMDPAKDAQTWVGRQLFLRVAGCGVFFSLSNSDIYCTYKMSV